MKWDNKAKLQFHRAVEQNINTESGQKLLKIAREKASQFPDNPRGFKEYEAYFKLHNVAIWCFYKGYKKYSKRTWKPLVDVSQTFGKDANHDEICVVADDFYRYYFPRNFAEKVLVLGGFP